MFKLSRIVKNSDRVFSEAAKHSQELGLPTVKWDKELKQVIRTWPDGRKEIIDSLDKARVCLS